MNNKKCNSLLPPDKELVLRSNDWVGLFKKFSIDKSCDFDVFVLLDVIEDAKLDDQNDDADNLSPDDNDSYTDEELETDDDFNVDHVANNVVAVIDKRKMQWQKNHIDLFDLRPKFKTLQRWLNNLMSNPIYPNGMVNAFRNNFHHNNNDQSRETSTALVNYHHNPLTSLFTNNNNSISNHMYLNNGNIDGRNNNNNIREQFQNFSSISIQQFSYSTAQLSNSVQTFIGGSCSYLNTNHGNDHPAHSHRNHVNNKYDSKLLKFNQTNKMDHQSLTCNVKSKQQTHRKRSISSVSSASTTSSSSASSSSATSSSPSSSSETILSLVNKATHRKLTKRNKQYAGQGAQDNKEKPITRVNPERKFDSLKNVNKRVLRVLSPQRRHPLENKTASTSNINNEDDFVNNDGNAVEVKDSVNSKNIHKQKYDNGLKSKVKPKYNSKNRKIKKRLLEHNEISSSTENDNISTENDVSIEKAYTSTEPHESTKGLLKKPETTVIKQQSTNSSDNNAVKKVTSSISQRRAIKEALHKNDPKDLLLIRSPIKTVNDRKLNQNSISIAKPLNNQKQNKMNKENNMANNDRIFKKPTIPIKKCETHKNNEKVLKNMNDNKNSNKSSAAPPETLNTKMDNNQIECKTISSTSPAVPAVSPPPPPPTSLQPSPPQSPPPSLSHHDNEITNQSVQCEGETLLFSAKNSFLLKQVGDKFNVIQQQSNSSDSNGVKKVTRSISQRMAIKETLHENDPKGLLLIRSPIKTVNDRKLNQNSISIAKPLNNQKQNNKMNKENKANNDRIFKKPTIPIKKCETHKNNEKVLKNMNDNKNSNKSPATNAPPETFNTKMDNNQIECKTISSTLPIVKVVPVSLSPPPPPPTSLQSSPPPSPPPSLSHHDNEITKNSNQSVQCEGETLLFSAKNSFLLKQVGDKFNVTSDYVSSVIGANKYNDYFKSTRFPILCDLNEELVYVSPSESETELDDDDDFNYLNRNKKGRLILRKLIG